MRFLAVLAVSAAVLTPALAFADPGQPQAVPAADAQSAATTASAAASPAAQPAPGKVQEVVRVTQPPVADNLDRIECRSSPPPTGTRLGASRECHTVREWNVRQQDSQQKLQETQMHADMGLAGPPGK
jgi:hypothetical protein